LTRVSFFDFDNVEIADLMSQWLTDGAWIGNMKTPIDIVEIIAKVGEQELTISERRRLSD